jgi:hypothetical protein
MRVWLVQRAGEINLNAGSQQRDERPRRKHAGGARKTYARRAATRCGFKLTHMASDPDTEAITMAQRGCRIVAVVLVSTWRESCIASAESNHAGRDRLINV